MLIAVAKWGIIINTLFYVYLSARFLWRNHHVPSTLNYPSFQALQNTVQSKQVLMIERQLSDEICPDLKLTKSKSNAGKMSKSGLLHRCDPRTNSHSSR